MNQNCRDSFEKCLYWVDCWAGNPVLNFFAFLTVWGYMLFLAMLALVLVYILVKVFLTEVCFEYRRAAVVQLEERRVALAAENQRLLQAGIELFPAAASASTTG